MTRINVGIPPRELSTKHLLAEHREIKRIPNQVRSGKLKPDGIPDTFRLGKGHVKFFYNKLGYLYNRYQQIYQECCLRRYNVQNYSDAWRDLPAELMRDYIPTRQDIEIVRERIRQRS